MARIVSYRTKHFEFQVPIDEWNEKKIPLPEGAGAQFIAPSDLTAILLESFYYDWSYEVDERMDNHPTLVYDEEWVGKEIHHFPWCKELFEFLDWLKKEYGWTITESWGPIVYNGLTAELARERGVRPEDIRGSEKSLALRERFGLAFSGYVRRGNLDRVGDVGFFWSASEVSTGSADCLFFDSGYVLEEGWDNREHARSVRCVSE